MAAAVAVGGTVGARARRRRCVVYATACARTFFDEEEADAVLARERADRRERLAPRPPRLELDELAPPIREHVLEAARRREAAIREAIERAELPYEEVAVEVDGFVRAMERTAAARADALRGAGRQPAGARRGAAAPGRGRVRRSEELVEALEQQARVQRRMEAQLGRFYDEMERMMVELDTVRGSLLSLSATEGAATQERLAGDVRSLRERMGAVADGHGGGLRERLGARLGEQPERERW